jgi:FAD/FMN-containing dehydrogenase
VRQTVGEALVIDNSKHRNILLRPRCGTAEVEPGIVLDHLNAWLKPHGLWFRWTYPGAQHDRRHGRQQLVRLALDPTATWCTTCAASRAWMATASCASAMAGTSARRALRIRARLAQRTARTSSRTGPGAAPRGGLQPRHLRRQSERPYTADGSVNLAHLLVGAEGTLAYTAAHAAARALPRARCWAW